MEKFESGDVVELKSGSPRLTVGLVSDEKVVLHYWDDQHNMMETVHTDPASVIMFRKINTMGIV